MRGFKELKIPGKITIILFILTLVLLICTPLWFIAHSIESLLLFILYPAFIILLLTIVILISIRTDHEFSLYDLY